MVAPVKGKGIYFVKGRITWKDQLFLLGITEKQAMSYPPGSRKPVNLKALADDCFKSDIHFTFTSDSEEQ